MAELAALTGLTYTADARLRETHAGRWEGLLAEDIAAADDADWAAWQAGDPAVRPGGGETRAEVADRACDAVADALTLVPGAGVLVVATHGGTARALIGRLLGLPEAEWHVLGGLANCSWSVLSEGSYGWRLDEHNAGRLPEPVVGTDDA